MKSIKFIAFAIAFCFSTTVMAQDAYRKAVEKFVATYYGNLNVTQMAESMTPQLQQMGMSAAAAEKKAKDFVNGRVLPTIIDVMTEEFKKEVTLDELNSVIKEFDTPTGKETAAHLTTLSSMQSTNEIQKIMMPAIQPLFLGGSPKPVPFPEVSASYKKLFSTYYKACNASSTLTSTFEGIKPILNQMPGGSEMIDKLQKFFADNGEAIILTYAKDTLTEADLKFLNKTFTTPAGKKVITASQNATIQIMPKMLPLFQELMGGM